LRELFELTIWDARTREEKGWLLQPLLQSLPATFVFLGIRSCALGDAGHEIAFFRYQDGAEFALLPGGHITLGYDRTTPFVPSAVQQESWKDTMTEIPISLEDCLDLDLSPLRQVRIAPFLIEAHAPLRADLLADLPEETPDQTKIEQVCQGGFRLPSTDEWEYACSGGTRALFRWGNETPPTRCYYVQGWNLHRQPNAFGLLMNDDTYRSEICEGGILRGGDGGVNVHGGFGNFYSWIPLATSFFYSLQSSGEFDIWLEEEHWRRVYPLNGYL